MKVGGMVRGEMRTRRAGPLHPQMGIAENPEMGMGPILVPDGERVRLSEVSPTNARKPYRV